MPDFSAGRAKRLFARNIAAVKIQSAYRARRARPAPRAIQKKAVRLNPSASYKLSKPMKKLVLDVLSGNKQDHWGIVTRSQAVLPYNASAANGANLLQLVPNINQAGYDTGLITADIQTDNLNSREGTAVKCKSITGKYTFYMNPSNTQDTAHQAIYLRVLTLSCKKFKTMKDIQNNWTTNYDLNSKILLDNKTVPRDWPGRPDYFNHPINRRLFTVHQDQKFLLSRGAFVKETFGGLPDGYAVQSRMPSMYKQVNIRVKCKNKILRYEEPSSEVPTNFCPFVVAYYSTFSGNNSSVVDNDILVHGSAKMTFEDL